MRKDGTMTRAEHDDILASDDRKQTKGRKRHAPGHVAVTKGERDASDLLDDTAILMFRMLKGEDASAAQLRCLPAYWTRIRETLGGTRAHEIRPVGHRVDGCWLLVIARFPEETLRTVIDDEISDVTRRATRKDARDIEEPIDQEVLGAIHLATWPEGPAAIEAIIKALDEMDGDRTPAGPTAKKAIVPSSRRHPQTHHMVVMLERGGKTDETRRRRAVEAAANIVAKEMSRARISLGVVLSGTSVRDGTVMVCLECSPEVREAIRGCEAPHVRIVSLKDPTCVDETELEDLRIAFQKSFMGTMRSIRLVAETKSGNSKSHKEIEPSATPVAKTPSRRTPTPTPTSVNAAEKSVQVAQTASTEIVRSSVMHDFMHPESFGATIWQGTLSHGFLSGMVYACYMIGLASSATMESIIVASMIMNMLMLPIVRRWGAPAFSAIGMTGRTARAALPRAANDAAPRPGPAISAPATPVAALQAPKADTGDGDAADEAWETILDAVGGEGPAKRVHDSREACARLVAMTVDHGCDAHTAAIVNTIRTTLPRLAEDLTHMLRHGDEPERTETIGRIVDATAHLARSADAGRKAMLKTVQDRITTTITYIETRTGSDDLSPLDDDTRNAA